MRVFRITLEESRHLDEFIEPPKRPGLPTTINMDKLRALRERLKKGKPTTEIRPNNDRIFKLNDRKV